MPAIDLPVVTPPLVTRHAIDLKAEEFRHAKRSLMMERGSLDKEARTVELSFASELPAERWFGNEILEISESAVDMSRLNGGGAGLVNHNWDDQVAVVTKAWVDPAKKQARAILKFSRSQRGEDIFQDINDGIRTLVSVGYIIESMVLKSVDRGVETHLVTRWLPYEISVVSVPHDPTVGVGRSLNPPVASAPGQNSQRQITMPPTETAPAPGASTTTAPVVEGVRDVAAERNRVKALNDHARTLMQRHPEQAAQIRELADRCAETGDGIDKMNACLLNDVLGTQRTLAPVSQSPATLGLKPGEVKQYSILKAVRRVMEGKAVDGYEGELNTELIRRLERQPQGFFVPDEIMVQSRMAGIRSQLGSSGIRTLLATSPADGGYTVGQDILASELVTLLRNQTRVVGLGARVISGLRGDITIPRQLTGATAYWASETGSITASSATFGQIIARPRRIGTSVPYTKQFLAQTSLDAEGFVVNDSDEAIATDIDRVAIRGIGGAEPLGILSLPAAALNEMTFSAAPTWAKYLEFFQKVAEANALMGRMGYLTTPASAVKAMTIPKFTNGDEPIWTGNPDGTGRVGMFPAEWSNQFPTTGTLNQVVLGDWTQCIILEWAGRDVVVDPYSGKKEGTVEITIQRLLDLVYRRTKSFCRSTDSGAQ